MKAKYDPGVDIFTLTLTDRKIHESDEVIPGLIVDYDEAGDMVALELSDASRYTKEPLSVQFEVTSDCQPAALAPPKSVVPALR